MATRADVPRIEQKKLLCQDLDAKLRQFLSGDPWGFWGFPLRDVERLLLFCAFQSFLSFYEVSGLRLN